MERLLVTTPKALSELLVQNAYEFPKTELMRLELERVTGKHGVLLVEGLEHKQLPLQRNRDIEEGCNYVRRVAERIIIEKKEKMKTNRSSLSNETDIVSVALSSGTFTDEELVDQMMTFLAAGHETTAAALQWAVYALCKHPDVQTRLREEVRANLPSISVENPESISATTLDSLPYLHAVCNEVLRFHPSVPLTFRISTHDTILDGTLIPKGTQLVISPEVINHHKDLWGDDADKFNPERWLGPGRANTGGTSSNYAFLTFLHGPRSCIGQGFAKAELASLLATTVGRFHMELKDPDAKLEVKRTATMSPLDGEKSPFVIHNDQFRAILGEAPTLELLAENSAYPFAHEAGIFIPSSNTLFITSNLLQNETGTPKIQITKVKCEEISSPIPMANGGVNYKDGIIVCAQGSMDTPGGIYYMSPTPPYATSILTKDFHGRPFNSVNDVVVHSDGSIWFTDPIYGFEQGYRPRPRLPSQVYRFNPATGDIRAVADGFGRPNGICFSPDEKTVYVTDTDWIHGDGTTDDSRVSSIYAFDVAYYHGQPFVTNRRLFAMADSGVPDGIKCDLAGNVYSGCGDGVHVWSPGGELLGRILIEGGVANFCFGVDGEMFLLNEHRLWKVKLTGDVKGALLGI
ncbi:hypothetical protein AOCH_002416 [Aspergillus ochraceoroseus]|uniref:SMP-30/Gluconolactonase/LRE-like region domain-containing protein n=1 Tax=Aspergillus ochraceoroseus TaxID=138278 RepID=A0A0F8WNT1_9EURO|nr:hypothetical protein AOCH_002416 [Aspergillus ochraceoroseus]